MNAPLKHCACGRAHTFLDWLSLPFLGVQLGDDEGFELRNCSACGSTLAIEAPVVVEAFVPTLLIVDGEREIARTRLWNAPMSACLRAL